MFFSSEMQTYFVLIVSIFVLREHWCEGFALKIKNLETKVEDPKKILNKEFTQKSKPKTGLPQPGSPLGVFDSAAIAADGYPCAAIGVDVLKANGSTADATIATMFCLGVVVSESMGIGGGFFLTYYDKLSKTVSVLDARETAPENAFQDMFEGDSELSAYGGLAIAVPGEVRGYWELYKRYGGPVPWADLIEPTIKLCQNGYNVSHHMGQALASKRERILNETSMSIFIDPSTQDLYKEGDLMKRPDLVNTLRELQMDPDAMYSGSLADGFLQDLQDMGSIITRDDLLNYKPLWKDPVKVTLANGGYTMYSAPPPASGIILGFILNILDNYNFTSDSLNGTNVVTTNQRIVEAFKYGYAKRTDLGDEHFVAMNELITNLTSDVYARSVYSKITDNQTFQDPEYYGAVVYSPDTHGTDHLSVWGNDGNVISVTSTVNLYFGSLRVSPSTGVILNDEMDDFSAPNITNSFGVPPSPNNFIEPGKRPVSSMCPAIFTDTNGDVKLVAGGAGGTMISTATAWVAMQNLWFGKNIKQAIDNRRLHHQLFPMLLQYEELFSRDTVAGLETIGHKTVEFSPGNSVVTGIAVDKDGKINANSDFRKGPFVDGF